MFNMESGKDNVSLRLTYISTELNGTEAHLQSQAAAKLGAAMMMERLKLPPETQYKIKFSEDTPRYLEAMQPGNPHALAILEDEEHLIDLLFTATKNSAEIGMHFAKDRAAADTNHDLDTSAMVFLYAAMCVAKEHDAQYAKLNSVDSYAAQKYLYTQALSAISETDFVRDSLKGHEVQIDGMKFIIPKPKEKEV
jgi:hypothetical protein